MTKKSQAEKEAYKEKKRAAYGVGYLRIRPGHACEYCELPDPDPRWRWLCDDCKARCEDE